jgi:DNA (cytosine-5)-methyltransferase 1
MTFGSLFAGIGGMDLGLERAGMTCKWQVEIDPFCNKILEKHWPDVKRYGDIRTVTDLEQVDLIAGGFPCQDISRAGNMHGIYAERSGLWGEYCRIIRLLQPKGVLVENVSALLDGGISRVLGELAACGYDAEWDCIPAASVGAPHIRDRIFIFAHSRCESRWIWQGGSTNGHNLLAEQGDDRQEAQRGSNRKLIALVKGVHPRTPEDWWRTQSSVDRSTYGVPYRLDRLKSGGNAVVPQVAEWIGRRIMEACGEVPGA